MASKDDMAVAPPLPADCIDFNKLHDAAKRGDAAEKAVETALIVPAGETPPDADTTDTKEATDNG